MIDSITFSWIQRTRLFIAFPRLRAMTCTAKIAAVRAEHKETPNSNPLIDIKECDNVQSQSLEGSSFCFCWPILLP